MVYLNLVSSISHQEPIKKREKKLEKEIYMVCVHWSEKHLLCMQCIELMNPYRLAVLFKIEKNKV